MPQISPISWVLIIFTFSLVFIMMKAHLTPVLLKTAATPSVKPNFKTFPW